LVLDIEKINDFLNKLKSLPKMWNTLEIAIAAYSKSEDEWVCLSMVFYASEKLSESRFEIPYEIPGKIKIIRQISQFSFDNLRLILDRMVSGSIKIGNINLTTIKFETIDYIKEKQPHWQREGLADKEGWPAFILRNYAKDDFLNVAEWIEIDNLVKVHPSEPHTSLSSVTLKYIGIEVSGGRRGAIYGVIPFYIKIEGVRFERNGDLAMTISAHNSITPNALRLNVVLTNTANQTENLAIMLTEKPKIEENFWMINKIIPNKIDAIDSRLFLIFGDSIVFEDWAKREDLQKKLIEKSKIERLLPPKEDKLINEK